MCHIWSSCTPTALREWHHFDQGIPVNEKLTMLPEKNWGAISVSPIFQNCMPQRKSNLDNISSSNSHRIKILVSTHVLWSKNQMKPLLERLGYSYVANSAKSMIAASKNNFMTKSRCLY